MTKLSLVLDLFVSFLFLSSITAYAGPTTRVSVNSNGNESNGDTSQPAMSNNSKVIAFTSVATNLAVECTNGNSHVFLHEQLTERTICASVDSNGNQGNNDSSFASISEDGRFVAFTSVATNLTAECTNGNAQIFVHHRGTGRTTCISVDSNGTEGNSDSSEPSMSGNARFVAFTSTATNLTAECTNGKSHIFIRNRDTGTTTCASLDSSGNQANDDSTASAISTDGRFVAFESTAINLAAECTNGKSHIFIRNRDTGTTTCASLDSSGNQGNDDSTAPGMSNGKFVAFTSMATNLAAACTNGKSHIFVRNRDAATTSCASLDSNGNQGNGDSLGASISKDNRFVAFTSTATNLTAECTNGNAHIFRHGRQNGRTHCGSVNSHGNQANGDSLGSSISDNGRFVTFQSSSTNLVPGDNNGAEDIFMHDFR